MALPNIQTPEHTTTLPLTRKVVKFRPFLTGEQKILLIALESKDSDEIVNAIIQIAQNCILTKNVNVEDLPSVDLEHIFLEIRKRSVGDTVDVVMMHTDSNNPCDHKQKVQINFNDVKYIVPDGHSNKIKISDDIGLVMKYPSIKLAKKANIDDSATKTAFKLLATCIESVYDNDKVYNDFTMEELEQWLEKLPNTNQVEISKFFDSIPYYELTVEYTCEKCGTPEKYTVKGLTDFFI